MIYFDKAPIGDPNDPSGGKRLTVALSTNHKPHEGVLRVLVDDTRGLDWIDVDVTLEALILAGMPAQGVLDAEEMLLLLDASCNGTPEWMKRRKVILPRPVSEAEPEAPKGKAAKS